MQVVNETGVKDISKFEMLNSNILEFVNLNVLKFQRDGQSQICNRIRASIGRI
jgi:hypothetical protein